MVILHRVKTEFTGLAGAPYLSTMFFDSGKGSATTATTVANSFWNAVKARQSTDLLYNVLGDVDQVDSETNQLIGVAQGTPFSGSGQLTDDVLPFATQGLIRWRTGTFTGGREIRGKTFIPGLTEAASVLGQLSSATELTLQTAADLAAGDPVGFFGVYSRKNRQFAPVVSGTVWNQFAVLRSRRD